MHSKTKPPGEIDAVGESLPQRSTDHRSLARRARKASAEELQSIPWWRLLDGVEQQRVGDDVQVVTATVGERVCRFGRPAALWFGVIDGLLKMSNDRTTGAPMTFAGLPSGAWFGEGTLLKREMYRYNIEALRTSLVAGLSIDAFMWLLERSLPFTHYLMNQLNERLGQFIAAREIDRSTDPDVRVARNLAALFHPVLYPGVGDRLRITQEELGYLVGLSRQRTNEALRHLQTQGLISVEYGGVRVLSLAALSQHRESDA